MSPDATRSAGDSYSLLVRQALDAGVYANVVALSALGVAVGGGVGLTTYFGCTLVHALVLAKQILFFGGFAVMGYGAVAMRPRTPRGKSGPDGSLVPGLSKQDGSSDDESPGPEEFETDPARSRGGGDAGPVQSVVEAVLAALSVRIAGHERITTGWKVVVAGFYVLFVTIAMELAGIHVVNFPCVPA